MGGLVQDKPVHRSEKLKMQPPDFLVLAVNLIFKILCVIQHRRSKPNISRPILAHWLPICDLGCAGMQMSKSSFSKRRPLLGFSLIQIGGTKMYNVEGSRGVKRAALPLLTPQTTSIHDHLLCPLNLLLFPSCPRGKDG